MASSSSSSSTLSIPPLISASSSSSTPTSTTSMTSSNMTSVSSVITEIPEGASSSSTTAPISSTTTPISTIIFKITNPLPPPPTPSIGESHTSVWTQPLPHPLFFILQQQQPFPTSHTSVWTQPQPAITRTLFPTITQPIGIDQIASGLHGLNLSGGFQTPLLNNGGLLPSLPYSNSFFPSALTAPNVTNLVMVKLTTVEDYLTWKTQFTALLISHNLLGFADGSCPPPQMYTDGAQLNPHYISWIRIDQSLRSWLFATLPREVLVKVHDLAHFFQIWDRL